MHSIKYMGLWLCKLATPCTMPVTAQQEMSLAEKGHSSFSFPSDTILQQLAWLQGDISLQCAIFLRMLPTANPLKTPHEATDHEFWLSNNTHQLYNQSRNADDSHQRNCLIHKHKLYYCQALIVTCGKTTIGSGEWRKDQSLRTDTYSKGYNEHLNTKIGHMRSGEELFDVMNAKWRRVIHAANEGLSTTTRKVV